MNLTINAQPYSQRTNNRPAFGNTLCIIKPNLFEQRGHIIKTLIKPEGFKIEKHWEGKVERDIIEEHYAEHRGKPFFEKLVQYMTGGDICVLELNGGEGDVEKFRTLTIDKLRPLFIEPQEKTRNGFHASDSVKSAEREISLWSRFMKEHPQEVKSEKSIDTQA